MKPQGTMRAIETSAIFDEEGKIFIENLPLIKNKKVKVLLLIDEEEMDNEFHNLSVQGLSKAYSIEEPEYDLSLVKEPNPSYKDTGR